MRGTMVAIQGIGPVPKLRMADTDEKWKEYPNTVLEFPADAGGGVERIDLRRALSRGDHATLERLGLTQPFAVFTAQNPNGDHPDDAEAPAEERAREVANAVRESALEISLRQHGIPFRRVDGVAPDGSYRERCVAAVMSRDAAAATAAELDQLALFWFDGDAFWLLPAEAEAAPTRLPKR